MGDPPPPPTWMEPANLTAEPHAGQPETIYGEVPVLLLSNLEFLLPLCWKKRLQGADRMDCLPNLLCTNTDAR